MLSHNSDGDDEEFKDIVHTRRIDEETGSKPDSPDFINRRHTIFTSHRDDSNNTSAYDLTVSNAGGGPPSNLTPMSHRGMDLSGLGVGAANQSKTGTSTNRTFADSVLNH